MGEHALQHTAAHWRTFSKLWSMNTKATHWRTFSKLLCCRSRPVVTTSETLRRQRKGSFTSLILRPSCRTLAQEENCVCVCVCDKTHSYVYHIAVMYVTSPCDVTHSIRVLKQDSMRIHSSTLNTDFYNQKILSCFDTRILCVTCIRTCIRIYVCDMYPHYAQSMQILHTQYTCVATWQYLLSIEDSVEYRRL